MLVYIFSHSSLCHSKLRHLQKKGVKFSAGKAPLNVFSVFSLNYPSFHYIFTLAYFTYTPKALACKKNRNEKSIFAFLFLLLDSRLGLLLMLLLNFKSESATYCYWELKRLFPRQRSRFCLSITTATDELILWLIYCRK